MFPQLLWQRGELLLRGSAHGALASLAVVLALAAAGALLPLPPARRQAVWGAAPALAILAGLGVVLGRSVLLPETPAERLPELVIGMFAAGLLAERWKSAGAALVLALAGAVAAAWWISGTPLSVPPRGVILVIAVSAAVLFAFAALARVLAGPWPLLGTAFSLWASLHLAGGAVRFAELALLVTASCIGLVLPTGRNLRGLWPVAAGLAGVSIASVLTAGRLPHGRLDRIDLAAIAPLLTLLLIAWLRRHGWGDRGAGALAALAAIFVIWIAGDLSR